MRITTHEELVGRLKELGGYTRKPRKQAIDTFYIIKHVATMHKDLDNDIDMFVSTTHLQNMGIHRTTYQRVFSYALEFANTEWEWVKGKCRTIKRWTPGFKTLLDDAKDLAVPEELIKNYSHSTTPLENAEELRKITGNLLQDYYTGTTASPFRLYNPLQAKKKAEREKLFEGYTEYDLKSAFTTVAFHQLGMKDCDLEMAWALHPENKDVLIDRIKSDFKCDDAMAKKYRCYLTAKKENFFGVKWFDKLHFEIERRVKAQYTSVEYNGKTVKINTPHKFFTYHEQQIMSLLKEKCDTILSIHDGLISKTDTKITSITYNGNSYPVEMRAL
jgi:hypothetical protein